jgi:antagonist of KipI
MMTVLKPGPLTTVQDTGRRGYRAFGMPLAGAMDRLSFALANVLAGNPPGAAALEMTLLGATVRLERDGYLAVCGADMRATLDGEPVPNGSGFPARGGSELVCLSAATGCRAYLAIHGGIDVPAVLGSASTYTRGAIGGFEGRALRSGDVLPIGSAVAALPRAARALPAGLLPTCPHELSLRVLLGPQDDLFLPEGVRTFLESAYTVSNRNDRMGYQLDGPLIAHRDRPDIVSDALCPGAIQVPGSGTPIVLMADCQTTGGYAKIATVIGPDLARLAQARFGDTVRFVACSDEEAVGALRSERQAVAGAAAAFRAPARRRAARG